MKKPEKTEKVNVFPESVINKDGEYRDIVSAIEEGSETDVNVDIHLLDRSISFEEEYPNYNLGANFEMSTYPIIPFSEVEQFDGTDRDMGLIEEDYFIVIKSKMDNIRTEVDGEMHNFLSDNDVEFDQSVESFRHGIDKVTEYMEKDPDNIAIARAIVTSQPELEKALKGMDEFKDFQMESRPTNVLESEGDVAIITRINTTNPEDPKDIIVYEPVTNENSLVNKLAEKIDYNNEKEYKKSKENTLSM